MLNWKNEDKEFIEFVFLKEFFYEILEMYNVMLFFDIRDGINILKYIGKVFDGFDENEFE